MIFQRFLSIIQLIVFISTLHENLAQNADYSNNRGARINETHK